MTRCGIAWILRAAATLLVFFLVLVFVAVYLISRGIS